MVGCGEGKENASNQKLEMPICGSRSGKSLLAAREIVVEVEHVKAHRTKKDKKDMSHFERCVTEGNEKADELAKAVAMLDEGFMAEAREKTMQQEREEVYAALQYAASFHCLVEEWKDCEELNPKPKKKWNFVDQKREETKHQTEWCAEANKYRCMRCGKSRCMEMPRKCAGPKFVSIFGENGKSVNLDVMIWLEEWIDREKF